VILILFSTWQPDINICFYFAAKREISEGEFSDSAMQVDFVPIYSSKDNDTVSTSTSTDESNNGSTYEDEDSVESDHECKPEFNA